MVKVFMVGIRHISARVETEFIPSLEVLPDAINQDGRISRCRVKSHLVS